MPGQHTTQQQREMVTARLFRRDGVSDIARSTGISKKTIWRIHSNLKTYGTPTAPKEDKPRGRPTILTEEEHEALAQYLLDNPIAVSQDMIDFVKERFDKEVNKSCVGHAIKRMGFSRIIIMRGLWATRQDLPPEAVRVHHVAADLIEKQMRINAEQKAQDIAAGTPKAQNKGRYAWVRLHPGEDTGFNPRVSKPRTGKTKSTEEPTSTTSTPADSTIMPSMEAEENYVSPYA